MARPKIPDSVILEIKSYRSAELTLDQIQDSMQKTRDSGIVGTPMPGRGSIAKYSREYDGLDLALKNLDKPFEYHRMEDYGLAWEAGSYLMKMWAFWKSGRGFDLMMNGVNLPMPAPTVREARWWWRVHLADPELGYFDVWCFAERFVTREVARAFLGNTLDPLDVADLEAHLAFRPWTDEESRRNYQEAIETGRIPPLRGVADESIAGELYFRESTVESYLADQAKYGQAVGAWGGGMPHLYPELLPSNLLRRRMESRGVEEPAHE